jgi:post-segregation antitoxin (ccd killing protein)
MTHGNYERGYDAAQRALDRSTLNASDLLSQARMSEALADAYGNQWLTEWNKGFADAVQEFLDEKGT